MLKSSFVASSKLSLKSWIASLKSLLTKRLTLIICLWINRVKVGGLITNRVRIPRYRIFSKASFSLGLNAKHAAINLISLTTSWTSAYLFPSLMSLNVCDLSLCSWLIVLELSSRKNKCKSVAINALSVRKKTTSAIRWQSGGTLKSWSFISNVLSITWLGRRSLTPRLTSL